MQRRAVLAGFVMAAVLAASPAVAQTSQSKTVTATGVGQARVHPKDRHSSTSIAAAVDDARKLAIKSALREAHEYAQDYAKATGLTLGSVISVSDVQTGLGFYGGPGGPGTFIGPFGPGRYCGTLRVPVGRPTPGHRPRFKKVRRCIVPPFAFLTLTVTYSAS
jgi:uncharacterized protein YggE